MSAIYGLIDFNKKTLSPNLLDTMKHHYLSYKIDRFEHKMENYIAMGCAIQYSTPEAELEQLPIFSAKDKLYLTADCILDNRQELIQLLNIEDISIPDGSLLYYAYLKWGKDCITYLRGIFSFAIYDYDHNELMIATDPFSERCIYYYFNNNICYFSTLVNPILQASDDPITLNEQFICDTLSIDGLRLELNASDTPYNNIYKIRPGHYIEIQNNSIKNVSYYVPKHKKNNTKYTLAEYGAQFKDLMIECVKTTLRSSGEIGVTLSSGLDSSTVGCIAASLLEKQEKKLYSYTFVPLEEYKHTDDPYYIPDESSGVKEICNMYPNITPKFLQHRGHNCYSDIKTMLPIMEIPFKAVQNIPRLYDIFNHAYKDHCRIILIGHYGNLTISQGKFEDALYSMILHGNFIKSFKLFNAYCLSKRIMRKPYGKYLLKRLVKFPFEPILAKFKNEFFKNQLVNPNLAKKYNEKKRLLSYKLGNTYKKFHTVKDYRKAMYDEGLLSYTGELNTKLGLAGGVVIRDPAKDVRMIDFCVNLPMECFTNNTIDRWLVRGNMTEFMPNSILLNTRHKGLQSADWIYRLNLNWNEIEPELETQCFSPLIKDFIAEDKIQQFFKNNKHKLHEHESNKADNIFYLSTLYQFLANLC